LRKWCLALLALVISLDIAGCNAAPAPTRQIVTVSETKPSLAASTVPTVSPYIGTVYPPLPSGWQDGRAALTATVGEVDYSVQEFAQADQQMLWFMKSTGRDAQGHVTWVVTDVLARSDIKEPGGLIWSFCTLNDQPDEEIVALGEVKTARMDNVTRAWRANHQTGRFEPIAPTGIVCEDETIGP
jgi:hypothetical protein